MDRAPGERVASQVLPTLDTDGDPQIADTAGQVYVDGMLRCVVLHIDEQPLAQAMNKIEISR